MLKETIESFDGRPLNVFYTGLAPQRPSLVLALPFGVRHQIADRLYTALAPRFNVVTWESRFVLDLEADPAGAAIEVDSHVQDLMHVARYFAQASGGGAAAAGASTDVIGYCSGAGIGLLAAARHPQAIRRLALISGEFMLPPSVCKQSGFQREVDALLPAAATSQAAAHGLFEKISSGRAAPRSEFHDFVSLPFSSAEYLYRFGLNYLAYRSVDFLRAAGDVAQPTLVMAAREDRQVTPESAEIVRARLARATGVLTVAGDHYELCRGNPEMTQELIRFFAP